MFDNHYPMMVSAAFARQLERSRDEWRNLAEDVMGCFPEDEFEKEPLKGFLTRFRELKKEVG